MTANSDSDICNLALGHLGNTNSVESIETPKKSEELICSRWYDVSRQSALKLLMPNCALARVNLAPLVETPAFGWTMAFQYPSNCLKVLGIGEVRNKTNDYAIEGERIYTDGSSSVLELRYIKDLKDVTKFTTEFVSFLSYVLADNICMQVTQSLEKKNYINSLLKQEIVKASAMNAQENRPIRINNSKFRASRYSDNPTFEKKL